MAETSLHPLTNALGLALPAGMSVRTAAQGLAAEHPDQGWRLTAFQRPIASDGDAIQLHATVLGSLRKRHPASEAAAPAVPVAGPGWTGLRTLLSLAGGRQLRVLTVLDSGVQIGVVLDVPDDEVLQPEHLLRATVAPVAAVSRAAPGPIDREPPAVAAALAAASPASLVLSLVPLEDAAPAAAAAAAAAPPTAAALSPAPVDAKAVPASAASATARARFGAREPSAGPVASSLQPGAPAAPVGPPPMPVLDPYRPPAAEALEAPSEADPEALRAAGRGQRILIWCVLLSFAARGLARNPEIPVFVNWAVAVALMALAFRGVLLIASGFGYGRGAKLGLMFGSTVPLLGIGLWVWLSLKTTRALRAAGHPVGFFGVKS